jgi:hypothetical protein
MSEGLQGIRNDLLQDLWKHIAHVDSHLSEHLTKQMALQFSGLVAPSRHMSSHLLQTRLLALGRLLRPFTANGIAKIRIGHDEDGGYVVLDDFARVGYALSFGVGQEVSWDLDLANRGIHVHQFDHTIDREPSAHEYIHFHRKKLAAMHQGNDEDLRSAQRYGDHSMCIIKIDIEGDEWVVLESVKAGDFSKVTQLICEFHDFNRVDDDAWYHRAIAVLEMLTKTFAVVHVHGNNNAPMQTLGNVAFPEILEVTFAQRNYFTFSESNELFPTSLDRPNRPDLPDIILGAFQF